MGRDVIIACDFNSKEEVINFLGKFKEEKPFVKIGMELFYAEGPEIVRTIKQMGHKIFLDLKLHDIPNTVKSAMRQLAKLDVDMVNVHASGGIEMMKAAIEGLEEGKTTTFDKVLLVSDGDKVTVGTDTVKGAKVKATVVGHGKAKKVVVFKYKPKKNERKVRGHRQPYTKIQIEKITTGTRAKKAAATEEVAE